MSQAARQDADSHSPADAPSERRDYVVVARRYRPQTFEELVGQQQIAQALTQAIATQRVGHAYLFTGARGVGKTSAARIFAKALNCTSGPTATPCNQCDSCLSVATGDDVDVLEIDGASNRGIDEVRQIRANANIRPSRSRLKIYIIDEVHMLTLQAFNALLKTLEEPPEHVKFIFCTTEPKKVPITVLSRCQRFDFAGIDTDSICARLKQIVEAEGAQADDEALRLLARRAAGSMRDSQSLLEQLLAFGGEKITAEEVHAMLGTARGGQLAELAGCLLRRDAAAALGCLDGAIRAGVDPGQMVEQLLGYFRDMMAALVGCQPEMLLNCLPEDHAELLAAGKQIGLTTVLALQQILDETLTRSRQSVHVRTLAELAIVRICELENLDDLPRLVAQLRQETPGNPAGPAVRQTGRPAESPNRRTTPNPGTSRNPVPASPPSSRAPSPTGREQLKPADRGPKGNPPAVAPSAVATSPEKAAVESATTNAPAVSGRPKVTLTDENARQIWDETLAAMGDMTAESAARYSRVAIPAPNTLEVTFSKSYTAAKAFCERPEKQRQLEQALSEAVGSEVRLIFQLEQAGDSSGGRSKPRPSQRELIRETSGNPLVRHAMELFDAHINRVDLPRNPPSDTGE